MITYLKNVRDITVDALRVQINSCGLIAFQDVDYHIRRTEWNVDYQLLYITEGVGHFYCNGSHLIAPAGSALLYAPGEVQEYGYTREEGALVWFCHFTGEGVASLLADCPIPTCTVLMPENQQEVKNRFSAIIPAHIGACGFAGAAISLLSLLQYISRCVTQTELVQEDPLTPAFADIRDNYMHERSIDQYATMCHLSKYHFLRLFKQKAGVTPVVYRNEYRLSVAEQLLAHSNLTIEAAAATVGFSSAAYFCRVYKKSRGHTCRRK